MRPRFLFGIITACIGLSVLYLLPQMQFSQPSILDVAETWSFGKDYIQNIYLELSNPARFRPLYVFERSCMNMLFSYHPQGYFLFFSFLLAATIYLGFRIVYRSEKYSVLYTGIIALFLVSPVTIDAYWRLGVAENLFVLAMIGSIYTLINARYMQLLVWLFVLMGSKETAIFVVPVFFGHLIYKKQYWVSMVLIGTYIIYAYRIFSLTQYALDHTDSYTALFSARIGSLVDMFWYYLTSYGLYTMMCIFCIGLCIYRLWFSRKKSYQRRYDISYLYIALIIVNIFSLLFFRNKYQPYYYFPVLSVLLLFFGREILHAGRTVAIAGWLYVFFLFILFETPGQTWNRMLYWQKEYAADGALFRYIENAETDQTFRFINPYRPEITNVLPVWYSIYQMPEGEKTQLFIALLNTQVSSSGLRLCGLTFTHDMSCKWQILSALE